MARSGQVHDSEAQAVMNLDSDSDENQDVFVQDDGRPIKFYLHDISAAFADPLTKKIQAHGGKITSQEKKAAVILVTKSKHYDALTSNHGTGAHPQVHMSQWIDECIKKKRMVHLKPPTRTSSSTAVPTRGKQNSRRAAVPFSEMDRFNLCRWIAEKVPDKKKGGRNGNKIYQDLEDSYQKGGKYCWANRHTWQSWKEHYKRNQDALDKVIDKIVAYGPSEMSKDDRRRLIRMLITGVDEKVVNLHRVRNKKSERAHAYIGSDKEDNTRHPGARDDEGKDSDEEEEFDSDNWEVPDEPILMAHVGQKRRMSSADSRDYDSPAKKTKTVAEDRTQRFIPKDDEEEVYDRCNSDPLLPEWPEHVPEDQFSPHKSFPGPHSASNREGRALPSSPQSANPTQRNDDDDESEEEIEIKLEIEGKGQVQIQSAKKLARSRSPSIEIIEGPFPSRPQETGKADRMPVVFETMEHDKEGDQDGGSIEGIIMSIFPNLNADCTALILQRLDTPTLLSLCCVCRTASNASSPYLAARVDITDDGEPKFIRMFCIWVLSKKLCGSIRALCFTYRSRTAGDMQTGSYAEMLADVFAAATSLRSVTLAGTMPPRLIFALGTLPSFTTLSLTNAGRAALTATASLHQLRSFSLSVPHHDIHPTFFADVAGALNASSQLEELRLSITLLPGMNIIPVFDLRPFIFPNVRLLSLSGESDPARLYLDENAPPLAMVPQFPNITSIEVLKNFELSPSDTWPHLTSAKGAVPAIVGLAQHHALTRVVVTNMLYGATVCRDLLDALQHCPVENLSVQSAFGGQYYDSYPLPWLLRSLATALPALRNLEITIDGVSCKLDQILQQDTASAFSSFQKLRWFSWHMTPKAKGDAGDAYRLYDRMKAIRHLLQASSSIQYFGLRIFKRLGDVTYHESCWRKCTGAEALGSWEGISVEEFWQAKSSLV
ncbi:hypothetical protein EVG20_g3562 [Dentipellis fragilis]|uniref:DNA-binding protein RAP1 n=1 Tax=Dentipellis fragilis TaxID=205917 RepID=A0A4Y9Z3F8_9AGAM|nr:hypothetical protein EVG20_g3562 [Dentipellis fragilis]